MMLYNEERPHAALGNTPPAAYYARSPRHWDRVLREPEYPAAASVRRVHRNGAIRWRGAEIYLSETLVDEPVGLSERRDGGWLVHYGPIELGVIDHRGDCLRKPKPGACGFVDNPGGLPTTPQAQPPQQQT